MHGLCLFFQTRHGLNTPKDFSMRVMTSNLPFPGNSRSSHCTKLLAAFLCAVLTAWGQAAQALYIRHDGVINDFSALALNPSFAAAGFFTTGGGAFCSGVLVASNKVLTAGHCAGSISTPGTKFGLAANITGATTYNVSNVVAHGSYTGASGTEQYDLAIATLDGSVLGITPATISTANLLGQTVSVIGYGQQNNGLGTDPGLSGYPNDRLGATNVIDRLLLGLWASDFDSPAMNTNLFGTSATPTALEGNVAPGDSGGPLFWNNFLVGITGYRFCAGSGCAIDSTYGKGSLWTRLDTSDNLSFLASNGISAVPLPGAWLAFLSGLISLAGLALRRQTLA
jgi:secreted trypsin-like serine protease